ncbi:MAG: archaeosortase A, partial [Methanomicrobiales archaeon]|nr:archaeosortase A [Methanomicrobiales archaeon]
AYTGQWFPYLPSIAGNGEFGYESFFWAHNVIAELLALVLLVGIAYSLFRIIPGLADLAADLTRLYSGEVRRVFYKDR